MSGLVKNAGFGCVHLTTFATPSAVYRLLDGAFAAGIRHFDTAPVYGQGYSERLLGTWLRDKRDQVQIATKFGLAPPRSPTWPLTLALGLHSARRWVRRAATPANTQPTVPKEHATRNRISRTQLGAAFDASRRALQADYIDLYLLHEGIPGDLEPAALDYLLQLRSDGVVKRIGLAANGSRYFGLRQADIAGWDVLQYESGPAWPQHESLPARFPTHIHIHHSCLKGIELGNASPNAVLAERAAANPTGIVLFSSRSLEHVRDNVRALAR
jgi:aryl-alcohol dehydrogenase-like predicted oxidoreductase